MKSSGNTILVTGGSSGIGRELARRLHDLGNTVVVAARDETRLAETVGDRSAMHAVAYDATDAAGTESFAKNLTDRFPALNVLINNAGIMHNESIASHRDLGSTEVTIAANLLGPIRLINALVDHLGGQPDAAIINVTSGLAFVPRASAAAYSATKAAMHSYTVSLRLQLEGRIEVIELAPPIVQTELTPGQSSNPVAMPLQAYVDEAIALLTADPTPPEVLVERVHRQRFAERNGTFDEIAKMMASR